MELKNHLINIEKYNDRILFFSICFFISDIINTTSLIIYTTNEYYFIKYTFFVLWFFSIVLYLISYLVSFIISIYLVFQAFNTIYPFYKILSILSVLIMIIVLPLIYFLKNGLEPSILKIILFSFISAVISIIPSILFFSIRSDLKKL